MALSDEDARKIAEQMKEVNKQASELDKAFNTLSKSNVDLVKGFSVLAKETDSFGKSVSDVTDAMGKLATKEGIANALNVAAEKLIKNSQELANSLDKARASYVKATGDIVEYGSTMNNMMYQASMGVTTFGADVSTATKTVRSSFPMITQDFENLAEAQRNNYASTITTISQFEILGISAQTTAGAIDTVIDRMNATGQSSLSLDEKMKAASQSVAKTTLELSSMGYTLEQSAQMIQKNTDLVIVFGESALKDLAATAKTTRIALDDLVAVSSKFDTFESAAQHVGKLNALLGADYLGVTDMMFAEPAEQVKMISGAFQQAGLTAASLDSMSEAEKKFTLMTVQSTLGLKDKQTAMKFLQADEFAQADILRQQAEEKQKDIDTQEKLNKILNDAVPVLDKLANAFKNIFSVLEPIFTALNYGISTVAGWMNILGDATKNLGEGTKTIIGLLALAAFWYGSKALAAKAASTVTEKLGKNLADLAQNASNSGQKLGDMAPKTDAMGKSAEGAWKNTLALGAAIALIGVGIGAASAGLAQLVAAFKDVESSGMALAAVSIVLVAFGAAVYFLATTGITASAGLIPLGFSLLMIGGAVAIAALGMAELVKAFGGLGNAAGPAANAIKSFSIAMVAIIAILAGMGSGPQALAIGIGVALLLGVGGAALMMGQAIKMAGEGLKNFGSIIKELDKLKELSGIMSSLSDSLESITDKTIKVNVEITGDLEALKAISKISTAATASGAVAAAPATTLAQPTISIKEIIVKFDDENSFKTHVEKIVHDTLKSTGVKTR